MRPWKVTTIDWRTCSWKPSAYFRYVRLAYIFRFATNDNRRVVLHFFPLSPRSVWSHVCDASAAADDLLFSYFFRRLDVDARVAPAVRTLGRPRARSPLPLTPSFLIDPAVWASSVHASRASTFHGGFFGIKTQFGCRFMTCGRKVSMWMRH